MKTSARISTVGALALAIFLGGCASTPLPEPPLIIQAERGARYMVLPMPPETLQIGDKICFYAGGQWVWGKIAQKRGGGVFRVLESDTLVTPSNFGGKMVPLQ